MKKIRSFFDTLPRWATRSWWSALLLLIATLFTISAGTVSHAAPITANLRAVAFGNATYVYAVGVGGTILASDDGGQIWSQQNSGTTVNLNAVAFVDALTGWAVGDKGTVVSTTDGGASWKVSAASAKCGSNVCDLLAVSFVDANTGFAAGGCNVVFGTSDGGASWTRLSGPTNFCPGLLVQDALSLFFVDGLTGWRGEMDCNESGFCFDVISKTGNGGVSWQTQFLCCAASGGIAGLSFVSGTQGWAVGSASGSGIIQTTSNGGNTWTNQYTNPRVNGLNSVSFVDSANGWVAGSNGTILSTTDGGQTWLAQNSGTTTGLTGVAFVDGFNGVAVGNATILWTSDGGTTWNPASLQ